MTDKINLSLKNKPGFEIDVDCCVPNAEHTGKSPLAIFSHGFKGFKDWGGFPYMMQKLSASGYVAVSFNFSHNGVGPPSRFNIGGANPTGATSEFTRLDLFAQNTFSKELDDLGTVIDYFYENHQKYNIDRNRLALIGHSRGGGISILKASEDNRVKCLVTLASVSTFDRYTDEHKKLWRANGYFEVLNTRTNQLMRLNCELLDDIENNKSRLDIIQKVSELKIPFLIIHGKEDLSVRHEEAKTLYNQSKKIRQGQITEILIIENTGHTFGVVHPFNGSTKAFDMAIEKIISFLNEHV